MGLNVGDVVEHEPPHSDVLQVVAAGRRRAGPPQRLAQLVMVRMIRERDIGEEPGGLVLEGPQRQQVDRKSTRLNSSHSQISYAVFCLKKKKKKSNVN